MANIFRLMIEPVGGAVVSYKGETLGAIVKSGRVQTHVEVVGEVRDSDLHALGVVGISGRQLFFSGRPGGAA